MLASFLRRVESRGDLPLLALAALAALCVLAEGARLSSALVDFKPLYCAVKAQRLGLQPYLIGSLHACEATVTRLPPAFTPGETAPAPLPPYYFTLLAPLSLAPYDVAAVLWIGLGLAACVAAARDLARLTGLRGTPVALAMSLGTFFLFAIYAQPMPLMLWGLVRAAISLEAGKPRRAALFASIALIQPHVGACVLLAIFVARPRARTTVVAIAAVLLGLVATQLALSIRYVRDVLPETGLAHASNLGNYGTAWMLHGAGLTPELAVRVGGVISLAAIACGIPFALAVARRYETPSLIVLLVPPFVLAFGIYAHVQQAALAVPAALVLCARSRPPHRLAVLAVTALAVPWTVVAIAPLLYPATFLVALGLPRTLGASRRMQVVAYLATIAIAGLGYVGYDYRGVPLGALERAGATAPGLDAEVNLAAMNAIERDGRPAVRWLLKLPTWIGYLALLAAAATGAAATAAELTARREAETARLPAAAAAVRPASMR